MKTESSTLSKGEFMSSPEATRQAPVFVNQQHSGSDTHEPTSIESALMAIQDYMKNSNETMQEIGRSVSALNDRISKIKTIQDITPPSPSSPMVSVRERVSKFVGENNRILFIGTGLLMVCGAAASYWKR